MKYCQGDCLITSILSSSKNEDDRTQMTLNFENYLKDSLKIVNISLTKSKETIKEYNLQLINE
jgi:endonuclease III